jgi:membrane-associated phospholipid phosphatase
MDQKILLALNSLTYNHLWVEVLLLFGNNALLRGSPVFFSLVLVWFAQPELEHQIKILAGLVATMLATVISVALQFLFTPHIRPFMDTALSINTKAADLGDIGLHRLSSFPSDSASLYFAVCTIIFLENRKLGVACGIWAFLTVGLCRVALGYHYPSDILGALVLGPGLVLISSKIGFIQTFCAALVRRFHISMPVRTALMFLFLGEAYNQFLGVLGLAHVIRRIVGLLAIYIAMHHRMLIIIALLTTVLICVFLVRPLARRVDSHGANDA